jgi:thymidine kinase
MEYTKNGFIEIILGPMFSGKSSELLKKYRRHKKLGLKCILVKYLHDTRYSKTGIATHDLVIQDKDVITCGTKLKYIDEVMNNYDVILIDEGQFFDDIVDVVDNLANNGKKIIIASLDGTFEQKPFGHTLELIPKAEKVKKIIKSGKYVNSRHEKKGGCDNRAEHVIQRLKD